MRKTLVGLACGLAISFVAGAASAQFETQHPSTPDMSDGQDNQQQDFQQAKAALDEKRYRDAAQGFEHVLDRNPRNVTVLNNDGLALEGMGDWRRAERVFAKSLRFDGDQLMARQEHGVALARLGKMDEAKAELVELKRRAAICDTCVGAADFQAAIDAVQAAIVNGPKG